MDERAHVEHGELLYGECIVDGDGPFELLVHRRIQHLVERYDAVACEHEHPEYPDLPDGQ